MSDMKVNILGTEYEIKLEVKADDMPECVDGCMDSTTKTISVAKIEPDKDSVKDIEEYKKKVLRHEITHAFLYESGLSHNSMDAEAWGCNEEVVDWIAIQSPKLFEVFKNAECL